MSAQRLSENNPDAKVLWEVEALDNVRPDLLALSMRVIAMWSLIDEALAGVVCAFVTDEHHIVADMLAAIENQGARSAAFTAAASRALGEDSAEWAVFDRLMSRINDKRRKSRNRHAHFVVGYTADKPDAMLLLDPRLLVGQYGSLRRFGTAIERLTKAAAKAVTETGAEYISYDVQSLVKSGALPLSAHRESDAAYVYDESRIKADIATADLLLQQVLKFSAAVDRQRPKPQLLTELSNELGMTPAPDPGDP